MKDAIDFLNQGKEFDAAKILQSCSFSEWSLNDSWMNGNRSIDGVDLELSGSRSVYEILNNREHPITERVRKAISAVLPADYYLKNIIIRAASSTKEDTSEAIKKELIDLVEAQKALLIAVSTGGPRIDSVNQQFKERQIRIMELLSSVSLTDPNPFIDLWDWYGKWSDGSLQTYKSRRKYISDLYFPLIDALKRSKSSSIILIEPTGLVRVDRNVEKITTAIEKAQNEEDFQAVALLCREALISLSQAVYDSEKHVSIDGVKISSTDSKRMLDSYISEELGGESNDYVRKHAKAAVDLAVNLQHKRTATYRDAALCVEATRSIINIVNIISGKGDPGKGES